MRSVDFKRSAWRVSDLNSSVMPNELKRNRRSHSSDTYEFSKFGALDQIQHAFISRLDGEKIPVLRFVLRNGKEDRILFLGNLSILVVEGHVEVLGSNIFPQHGWTDLSSSMWNSEAALSIEFPMNYTGSVNGNNTTNSVIIMIRSSDYLSMNEIQDLQFQTCPSLQMAQNLLNPDAKVLLIMDDELTSIEPTAPITIPCSWRECALNIISNDLTVTARSNTHFSNTILLCGMKNVGKSTFSRFLINHLLEKYDRILYLETDLGQSEFTPCGIVSVHCISAPLLGPPHTHLQEPIAGVYCGTNSSADCPEFYLRAIQFMYRGLLDLVEYEGLPLVINTQGWIKGLGLEFISSLISLIQPCHLVQLAQRNHDIVMSLLKKSVKKNVHFNHLIDGASLTGKLVPHASVFRHAQTAAYFLKNQGFKRIPVFKLSKVLSSLCPYIVPFESVELNILTFNDIPHVKNILSVFNQSLVALSYCQDAESRQALAKKSKSHPVLRVKKINLDSCEHYKFPQYIGLGIIRAIDPIHKIFYVYSPVSSDVIREANVFVKGNLTIPSILSNVQLDDEIPLHSAPYQSSIAVTGAGTGSNKARGGTLLRRYQVTRLNTNQ